MRVAIIGSGPSGLVSAKHCLTSLTNLEVLHIYEKLACLGGAWCDDKKHTILYDNLRTNLPTEIMEFEGLSYENGTLHSSFVTSSVVTKYIAKYAEMFQLKNYIKFETQVVKVSRIKEEWKVTTNHLPTNQTNVEKYDVIFVCNGHYYIPQVPNFTGLEKFKSNKGVSKVIHSMDYRRPDIYKGLDVLIIGGGPSAVDICIEISSVAKHVYLSHHVEELLKVRLSENTIYKPDVEHFIEDGVTFVDGTTCQVDNVILATGFRYQLEFLDDSCGVCVEEHVYVTPLYKQFISISNPTMAFIGLPHRTFIFPLLETQVKCMIQILNGKATLPSADEMHRDRELNEKDLELRGIPKRKYHNISRMVRQYMEELFKLGNLEPIEEVIFNIYEMSWSLRRDDLVNYRNYKFTILDSERYEIKYISPEEINNK